MKRFTDNLVWGAMCGLFLGMFYALFGVGLYVLRGSPEFKGLTAGGMLLLYLCAGLVGGLIVGAFRPLLGRRVWASVVGMLALLPMAFGAAIMIYGPVSDLGFADYFSAVVTAIILGGFGGYQFWEPRSPNDTNFG